MFGIAPSELMVVALVALVLIGPQDLPRALRFAGQWIGRGRAMSRQLRGTMDELMRQAEISETHRRSVVASESMQPSTLADRNAPGDFTG